MKNITRINLNVVYDLVVLCRRDRLGLEDMMYEAHVAPPLVCVCARDVRVVVLQRNGAAKKGSVSDIAMFFANPLL